MTTTTGSSHSMKLSSSRSLLSHASQRHRFLCRPQEQQQPSVTTVSAATSANLFSLTVQSLTQKLCGGGGGGALAHSSIATAHEEMTINVASEEQSVVQHDVTRQQGGEKNEGVVSSPEGCEIIGTIICEKDEKGQQQHQQQEERVPFHWFPCVSTLGAAILDGSFGDVIIDVTLFGRLLSDAPNTFLDYAEDLICSRRPTSSGSPGVISVFLWLPSAGQKGYEVSRRNIPLVEAFLVELLESQRVRKVLLHATPLFRLIAALFGTMTFTPNNIVDLSVAHAVLGVFGGGDADGQNTPASSSSFSLSDIAKWLLVRDPSAVHSVDVVLDTLRGSVLPEATTTIPSSINTAQLCNVEKNLRLVNYAYQMVKEDIDVHILGCMPLTPPPSASGGGGDHEDCSRLPVSISPLELDVYMQWMCETMHHHGMFMDGQKLDAAVTDMQREESQLASSIVDALYGGGGNDDGTTMPDASTTAAPPRLTRQAVIYLKPDEFLHYLKTSRLFTSATETSPESSAALNNNNCTAERSDSSVELLRMLASDVIRSSPSSPPSPTLQSVSADYLALQEVHRALEEVKKFVQRFARVDPSVAAAEVINAHQQEEQGSTSKSPSSSSSTTRSSCWLVVHAQWIHKAATTGRIFSIRPSLQTLSKTQHGRSGSSLIRSLLSGPPNTVLISVDYSQIELRVLAHLSQDATLTELLNRSSDHHDVFLAVAHTIFDLDASKNSFFGIETTSALPELRRLAKTVVYSILYGMSTEGVARLLSSELKDLQKRLAFLDSNKQTKPSPSSMMMTDDWSEFAATAIHRFFTVFHRVGAYLRDYRCYVHHNPVARGPFRNRRLQTGISNAGGGDDAQRYTRRRRFESEAVSYLIQGTAADITKLAIWRITLQLRDAYAPHIADHQLDSSSEIKEGSSTTLPPLPAVLVYSAHDELVFAVPEGPKVPEMEEWLSKEMIAVGSFLKLRIPLKTKSSVSKTLQERR